MLPKERMFTSLVDLICQSIFLGISPGVKEGLGAFTRGERKDLSAYKAYLQNVSTIIKNATWWMHEVVPKLYKPEPLVRQISAFSSLLCYKNYKTFESSEFQKIGRRLYQLYTHFLCVKINISY